MLAKVEFELESESFTIAYIEQEDKEILFMESCSERAREKLAEEKQSLVERYAAFQSRGLNLNMSRGVPSKAQLDLSQDVLTCLTTPDDYIADGADSRSYGIVEGLQ